MTLSAPVVSWFNVDKVNSTNSNTVQIAQPYDFGVVDAGYVPTSSDYYSFLIWNNRMNTTEGAPQMEEVTIGIKDMNGGNGDTVGSEVWAINGTTKWFWAKVDSLSETDANFAQIGADLAKPIGTTASTEHPDVPVAVAWGASVAKVVGDVVKPITDNGYIYKVTVGGTTGTTEPVWSTIEGATQTDGTVTYEVIKKLHTPSLTNILLGGVNDGTMAKAGGNFSQVTLKAEIPLDAKAGRQDFKLRVN